jgi:hypothetical protein
MDAYDLSNKIKDVWVENSDKRSGLLDKKITKMSTIVSTADGYREVLGVRWNKEMRKIELILDKE